MTPDDVSVDGDDGWLLGVALDGKGGARTLSPWDEGLSSKLRALKKGTCEDDFPGGVWVHRNIRE